MTLPRVVMASMWRNDCHRRLVDRVEHLLSKCESYPNLSYVWVVGDSTDGTARALADLSTGYDNVRIVEVNTGIAGDDPSSRLRRLSATANHYFDFVAGADYVLVHESDLVSPYALVSKLIARAENGYCPVAAWPVLEIKPGRRLCYDVWALRKDGVRFSNHPPYHACYRPDAPFVVDSFGTCFMFHAEDAPLLHMTKRAVLDMCRQLKAQGRTLWVDPTLEVQQPADLWQFQNITKEYA